jgi:lipopolysaccharide transport system permease protein
MDNVRVIRPTKPLDFADIGEIWTYKGLLYFFIWRDLKVRYKQTALGVLWAVFQPFITMVVFSSFFGAMLSVPSDNVPYPIFVYTGLLFWQFFSGSITDTSNVLVSNQSIITKVYFPRLVLPISVVATRAVDFGVASVVMAGLMAYYGYVPPFLGLLLLPLLATITFAAAVGAGLLLATLNVRYRDVRYALPFFVQIMLFLTPVIYPASITGKYYWLLSFNPMTGVIQTARAALLTSSALDWALLGESGLVSIVLLILGVAYFKAVERDFADII